MIAGCPDYNARFLQYSPCNAEFVWLCTGTDKVGPWDVWTSNSNSDHNWELSINFAASTTITRIEIYELDENLLWTTGQAWATNNPVHPFPDPTVEFPIYPLRVEDAGTPVVDTDYVSSVGSFSGQKDFQFYGDIRVATPTDHFFHLKMFTVELGLIEAITASDSCGAVPPPCPNPSMSLDASCTGGQVCVDVTINNPFVNNVNYVLTRTRECVETIPTLVNSGPAQLSPGNNTISDCQLPPDCRVIYEAVLTDPVTTCQVSTGLNPIVTRTEPTITITEVSSGPYYNNGSSTLEVSVTSDGHDSAAAGCGATIPVKVNGTSWDTVTPNTTDNASNTVVLPPFVVGDNTVTAEACNECEAAQTATLNVEVEDVLARCDRTIGNELNLVEANGGATLDFLGIASTQGAPTHPNLGCSLSGVGGWDGKLQSVTQNFNCEWTVKGAYYVLTTDGVQARIFAKVFSTHTDQYTRVIESGASCNSGPNVTGWIMTINICRGTEFFQAPVWTGYKAGPFSPVGTYTFLADMCWGTTGAFVELPLFNAVTQPPLPATLSIELVT